MSIGIDLLVILRFEVGEHDCDYNSTAIMSELEKLNCELYNV